MRRAIYREDGGKFLVEVLSDETDSDKLRTIELRCIETQRASPVFGAIEPDEEFNVCVVRGYESYVGWTLTLVEDEPS